MKKTEEKGITLVALIITIIILLILAGIAISSLTQSGLFTKTNEAKEKIIKAQLKEEIQMAIAEIQIDELPKGNNVTLETLANGQLVNKLTDITVALETNDITGEYKNYDYTIDADFNVEIGGQIGGIKPTGIAEILTTGYMFEGEGTVEIKVTGNITEGTLTQIIAPSGATLKTDTSTTEKIYTVEKSGKYVFTVVGDSGRKTNIIANVENILSVPQIKVDEITSESFRINIENNYPEGVITEYKYYVGDELRSQETVNKSYIAIGLMDDTEYGVKVIAYINTSSKESNIEKVSTLEGKWSEEYQTTSDYIDEYGNIAKIPEGFQVSTKKGETNLNEGLVVRNATDKNEFVWIPVPDEGKIYVNQEKTQYKIVELDRYTFDTNGIKSKKGTSAIADDYNSSYYHKELETVINGRTPAKSINKFKNSVSENKGYYIGRYEARTETERNKKEDELTPITLKGEDYIYNFVTQPQAAELAQNMYDSNEYTSDLINSYAWDTALVFLQECGNNPTYSIQSSINIGSSARKGTNDKVLYLGNSDVQCNVYDMASNLMEWSTETASASGYECCNRGGGYITHVLTLARYRFHDRSGNSREGVGFRPILYL